MICGLAKIRSVHTYVIPWIHWFEPNCTYRNVSKSIYELLSCNSVKWSALYRVKNILASLTPSFVTLLQELYLPFFMACSSIRWVLIVFTLKSTYSGGCQQFSRSQKIIQNRTSSHLTLISLITVQIRLCIFKKFSLFTLIRDLYTNLENFNNPSEEPQN